MKCPNIPNEEDKVLSFKYPDCSDVSVSTPFYYQQNRVKTIRVKRSGKKGTGRYFIVQVEYADGATISGKFYPPVVTEISGYVKVEFQARKTGQLLTFTTNSEAWKDL